MLKQFWATIFLVSKMKNRALKCALIHKDFHFRKLIVSQNCPSITNDYFGQQQGSSGRSLVQEIERGKRISEQAILILYACKDGAASFLANKALFGYFLSQQKVTRTYAQHKKPAVISCRWI
ncbi:MAG: hypothetical protein ABIQ11_04660 [Saprospiraceae bacterium]